MLSSLCKINKTNLIYHFPSEQYQSFVLENKFQNLSTFISFKYKKKIERIENNNRLFC
jgi:hypothetical protein